MGNNRTIGTDRLYFYGLIPPPNITLAWNGSYLVVSWDEIYTPDVKIEVWQSINGGDYVFAGLSELGASSINILSDNTATVSVKLRIVKDATTGYFSNPVFIDMFIPSPIDLGGYYIAPNGNDITGDGSFSNPFFSLEKVWSVLVAGDTCYCRGGTYQFDNRQDLTGKSGAAGNLISILNYPNEVPIFTITPDFNRAVQGNLIYIESDYLHIRGFEVTGLIQTLGNYAWSAFFVNQTNHSIYERINYHHNGGSFIIQGNSDDNLVQNCDFHHNYDPYGSAPYDGSVSQYTNTDGMAFRTINHGLSNTIQYCRAWNNGDDGFDLWDNDGYVLLDGCWSFNNGFREDGSTPGGDGAGFKLGETSADYSAEYLRTIQNCLAVNNRMYGISQNGALCMAYVYNNTVYGNGYRGIYFSSSWGTIRHHIVRNNIAYGNVTNTLITADATVDHNSWNAGYTCNDNDFQNFDESQQYNDRTVLGALPDITFLHLVAGSDLINTGVNVGLPFSGAAPDLGCFETP